MLLHSHGTGDITVAAAAAMLASPAVIAAITQALQQAGQAKTEAVSQVAQAGINAIPQMYAAMQEARSRIREAELAMATGVYGSLSGGMGTVLSTIDRPFLQAEMPNKAGGTTTVSISLQTIMGLLATQSAYSKREAEPDNWNRIVETWLQTIDYVPAVSRTGTGAVESVTTSGGSSSGSKQYKYPDWISGAWRDKAGPWAGSNIPGIPFV